MINLDDQIKKLASKAVVTKDSDAALRYSQAALNLANVVAVCKANKATKFPVSK